MNPHSAASAFDQRPAYKKCQERPRSLDTVQPGRRTARLVATRPGRTRGISFHVGEIEVERRRVRDKNCSPPLAAKLYPRRSAALRLSPGYLAAARSARGLNIQHSNHSRKCGAIFRASWRSLSKGWTRSRFAVSLPHLIAAQRRLLPPGSVDRLERRAVPMAEVRHWIWRNRASPCQPPRQGSLG